MHELLQTNIVSSFLYKILIIIETIQLLYYSIHPRMDGFLWSTSVLSGIRSAIQYFQFQKVIDDGNTSITLALLYVTFGIMILVLLLMIGVMFMISREKKSTSTLLTYAIKILSLFAIILTTIGTVPFLNAFVAILYCVSSASASVNFQCYQGIYFLHVALSVIGLILLIIYSIVFNMLYIDLNPSSTIPFAAPQSRIGLYRLLLKTIIIIYIVTDYSGSLAVQYICILTALYVILLILRYRTTQYYNYSVQLFVVFTEAALTWVSLCSALQAVILFSFLALIITDHHYLSFIAAELRE